MGNSIDKNNRRMSYKVWLIPVICGLLTTLFMIFAAKVKDDTIQCKVIYDFSHEFGYEPYLFLEGQNGSSYELRPQVPEDDTFEIVYAVFEERYTIPYEAIPAKNFSLQLLNSGQESRICSIEFYNHGYQVAKYSASDIQELFDTSEWDTKVYGTYICITHDGRIQLQAKEQFYEELAQYPYRSQPLYWNSIFWGCLTGLFVFTFLYRKNKNKAVFPKKDRKKLTKWEIALALGLLMVFALACAMSLFSKHYSHPDETVTRMATDYYLAGWLRPDMNSSMVSGTFSMWGHNRLAESNLYYFLAGKVGWLFREFFYIPTYYRMFNLLLLGGMLLFCWRKREKHLWPVVALCMTPQIWYLFSYATSDAWDWFCGFVMVCMILRKEKDLYDQQNTARLVVNGLIYSFIFAMILLGKSNYMALLGIAFVDFLLGWFQHKTQRLSIFILYLAILAASFGIKAGIEHLPTQKQDIAFSEPVENLQAMVREERNSDNQAVALGYPKSQGVPLSELALPTLGTIFQSANGYYMWMTYESGMVYYIIMGLIQMTFLAVITNMAWKNRKGNLIVNIKSAYALFSFFLMILVVLLYCWMVTYQPQGRYLLMVWLFLGYLCAQYKDAFDSKALRGTIAACMCAGFWSFAYYGMFTMLKNGCLFVSYQKILNIIGFFLGN